MDYNDYKELSGIISEHGKEMDVIRDAIRNFQAICEISRKEHEEKIEWAMDRIHDLNDMMRQLNDEYMEECEAIYRRYMKNDSIAHGNKVGGIQEITQDLRPLRS